MTGKYWRLREWNTGMNKQRTNVDLMKMGLYILRRAWLIVICAVVGYGVTSFTATKVPDRYTASGTLFVTNSNPNLVNYGYASYSDFSNAVQLVNVYSEVIKSESVMQKILEYRIQVAGEDGAEQDLLLGQKYPFLTTGYSRGTGSLTSGNDTPVTRVSCTTTDPQL